MDIIAIGVAKNTGGGSGGGGTTDYTALENLPKINEVKITGELDSVDDLKIAGEIVEGKTYTIDNTETTASVGAEIFNDYEDNIATGMYSHAEGQSTEAYGQASHVEGLAAKTIGGGSHAEGYYTMAYGDCSHSEGQSTYSVSNVIEIDSSTTDDTIITAWTSKKFSIAKNEASHVEGKDCLALGNYSHAEGNNTIASTSAHSEGLGTFASGLGSHAGGQSTIASKQAQTVIGRFNTEDTNTDTDYGKYAFIIGNGTADDARSNALTVDWNGNIYVGNTETGVSVLDLLNRVKALETAIASNKVLLTDDTTGTIYQFGINNGETYFTEYTE